MSNIEPAFLKAIMIDEVFSYIDDLEINYFQGDDKDIFMVCAYLYKTKHHPSYEQVKSFVEVAKEINQYKRDDLLKRLQNIRDCNYILPPESPVLVIKREYENNQIEGLKQLSSLEHENKIKLIKKIAENLSEDVRDSNTFILQDEINKFADELESGVANDTTGSIDISNYNQRFSELQDQMKRWIDILGSTHIMPKFYLIGARPGDYKTSMLIDLNIMLYKLNYRGLYFSFEDTKDDLRIKFLSQMYGYDKKYLSTVKENQEIAKTIRKPKDEKIIIHDRVLDYDKLMATVDYYMHRYKIDFISLDYVQLFTGKPPIKERLDYIAQEIMEVTRKYKIPFFVLSQVTKDDTDKDSADTKLHKRHVKESKKLSETPRYMGFLYGDNTTSVRKYNRDKNTWGGCGEITINFDPLTGKIKEVY